MSPLRVTIYNFFFSVSRSLCLDEHFNFSWGYGFGMWDRVLLSPDTDVSYECVGSRAMFRRSIPPASWKQNIVLLVACVMMVSCVTCSSTVNMEAICFSETSGDFRRATHRYIAEDRTLTNKNIIKSTGSSSVLHAWFSFGKTRASLSAFHKTEFPILIKCTSNVMLVQGEPPLWMFAVVELGFALCYILTPLCSVNIQYFEFH
jgi:hypothetical protein